MKKKKPSFSIILIMIDIFFSEAHVLASLDYLASLHSVFWNKLTSTSNGIHDLVELWPSGTYWTLDKRPSNELQILPGVWADFCKEYSDSSGILLLSFFISLVNIFSIVCYWFDYHINIQD